MSKSTQIVTSLFALSCVGAIVCYVIGARIVGNWMFAPALLLSGWTALGHLVTLDDDMPGEWSNPQRSRPLWQRSLVHLLVKLLVFSALLGLFISQQ